jgi:hypothetical protein
MDMIMDTIVNKTTHALQTTTMVTTMRRIVNL